MRPSFYNLTPLRRYVPLRHNAGCPRPLLKGFANRLTLSGFNAIFEFVTQGSRPSNPGLKLANAFGVISC
jgi:hypothetical protein